MNALKTLLGFLFLLVNSAYALDAQVLGSEEYVLNQPSINQDTKSGKVIRLLKIELSPEAKKALMHRAQDALNHTHEFSWTPANPIDATMPARVQVGMNNVPVLDQGIHGSCVTFSVTAAIDAFIGKKDYISQLCNLQLGSYLEQHGEGMSGWNGSYTIDVINQIQQYGIVNMDNQKKIGCGGLKKYPTNSSRKKNSFIEPEKFSAMSELVIGKFVNWSEMTHFNSQVTSVDDVKEALNSKNRVVVGVLIPRTDLGIAGAIGKHKTWITNDTWVLTSEIIKGVKKAKFGHNMVITGYDDNAVAYDHHLKKHRGLFTLRNSWGTSYGNHGTFYMSYDYFKLLSYDFYQISSVGNMN